MTKSQKGGKILGQGRDGCVTAPPYMCTKKLDPTTHVSKLLDNTKIEAATIIEEYNLGKILLKADPTHKYFLPYVDVCKYVIDEKKLVGKPDMQKKYYDMQKCGYGHNKTLDVSALILPKGQPFDLEGLSMKEKLKAIYHCAKIINKLGKMRMVHFDIKQDNMLMYKGHPTLIDFTPDFVFPTTKENFEDFSDWFGRQYYFAWPREMFQITHVIRNDMYQKKIGDVSLLDKNLPREYIKEFKSSMYNTREFKYYDYIYDNQFVLFCDKMMMYSIGSAIKDSCGKVYPQIIDSMMDDYDMRPSSTEVMTLMEGQFGKAARKNVIVKISKNVTINSKDVIKPSTKKQSPKLSKKKTQSPVLPTKKSVKQRVKVKYQKTPAIVAKAQRTPGVIDNMQKKDLIALIKKYKAENCPSISGLSLQQIKTQITKYDSSIIIGSKTKKELTAILKKQKDARCKDIKITGSKDALIKQIIKYKITK